MADYHQLDAGSMQADEEAGDKQTEKESDKEPHGEDELDHQGESHHGVGHHSTKHKSPLTHQISEHHTIPGDLAPINCRPIS